MALVSVSLFHLSFLCLWYLKAGINIAFILLNYFEGQISEFTLFNTSQLDFWVKFMILVYWFAISVHHYLLKIMRKLIKL